MSSSASYPRDMIGYGRTSARPGLAGCGARWRCSS